MKFDQKKCVSDNLRKYDYLAKDDDYIEITDWINTEGWDIDINGTRFSLTRGQLDCINHLVNSLEYNEKSD